MGIKSRSSWKMNGCFPSLIKCCKCVYNDECADVSKLPRNASIRSTRANYRTAPVSVVDAPLNGLTILKIYEDEANK